jgi:lysophospholipase L1-like esterase
MSMEGTCSMTDHARRLGVLVAIATLAACHRSSGAPADLLPVESSAAAAPAPPTRVPVMRRISVGRPAFSGQSMKPASAAFDEDYGTAWRSGRKPTPDAPDWIAVDLSAVPAEQRETVYSVWFNEAGYNYDTADGYSYALPGDFEIQSHAPGGGRPPTTGWVTLASRHGNTFSSGADLLHLGGATWLRFVCTATAKNAAPMNEDTQLQWELHDAHANVDAWKFVGDSITSNSMGHRGTNDAFDQLVHHQMPNLPAFEMGGHSFWTSGTVLGVIDAYLASFPGRYVGLALGTNDGDPEAYRRQMRSIIDKVLAAGKIPVLPTVPYTAEPQHMPLIPRLNAVVRELYASYGARLVVGPDLYTVLYDGRATLFDADKDLLHPNERGNAAIRRAWADAMVERIYRPLEQDR